MVDANECTDCKTVADTYNKFQDGLLEHPEQLTEQDLWEQMLYLTKSTQEGILKAR